ncbi:MAG: hypothetical protein ABIJ65_14090 [Chloroflexota bacterium]
MRTMPPATGSMDPYYCVIAVTSIFNSIEPSSLPSGLRRSSLLSADSPLGALTAGLIADFHSIGLLIKVFNHL